MSSLQGASPLQVLMAIDQTNQRRAQARQQQELGEIQQQNIRQEMQQRAAEFQRQQEAARLGQMEERGLAQLMAIGNPERRAQTAQRLLESGVVRPQSLLKLQEAQAQQKVSQLKQEQVEAESHYSKLKHETTLTRRMLNGLQDQKGNLLPSKYPAMRHALIQAGVEGAENLPEEMESEAEFRELYKNLEESTSATETLTAEPQAFIELSKELKDLEGLHQRGMLPDEEYKARVKANIDVHQKTLDLEAYAGGGKAGSPEMKNVLAARAGGYLTEQDTKRRVVSILSSDRLAAQKAGEVKKRYKLPSGMATQLHSAIYGADIAQKNADAIGDILEHSESFKHMFTAQGRAQNWLYGKLEDVGLEPDPTFRQDFLQVKQYATEIITSIRKATTGAAASDSELKRLEARLNASQTPLEFRTNLQALVNLGQQRARVAEETLARYNPELKEIFDEKKRARRYAELIDQEMVSQGIIPPASAGRGGGGQSSAGGGNQYADLDTQRFERATQLRQADPNLSTADALKKAWEEIK